MPETNDVRTFVNGAEQAEARGDHAAAERLLRRALVLQETSLGAQHPEVANTLNNLAIVCEMTGKLSDAEACYRRAYAIAISSFPASDPFVTTSRSNLEQFCTARAIPFTQPLPPLSFASMPTPPGRQTRPPAPPPPPPPKAAAPPPPPARSVPPAPQADVFRPDSPTPAPPKAIIVPAAIHEPSRGPSWALAAGALVVVLGLGWFIFGTATPEDPPVAGTTAPDTSSSAAPSPEPSAAPSTPIELPREPETTPPPAAPTAAVPEVIGAKPPATPTGAAPTPELKTPATPTAAARTTDSAKPPASTVGTSSLDVVSTELCRSLTTSGVWKCAPATGSLTAGPMVFYTRVASPRDTTIEHRWYREDRLHQRVPLRIRANPSGYRTYSRTAITADRAGSWKVELRSQEGLLLDEKTFVVQ